MRNIHPAAWVGLFLNLLMGWMLFSGLSSVDLNAFPGEEREVIESFVQTALAVRPIFMGLLVVQAIALALISTGSKLGLPLSMIAGLLTLPGSIIYMLGSAMSNCRVRYADFRPAPSGHAGALYVFPAAALKKARVWTLALIVGTLAAMWMGSYDAMIISGGMVLAGAYCMWRAAKNNALGLHERHFVLSPAFFAQPLLIFYDRVLEARLVEGKEGSGPLGALRAGGGAKIRFRVETGAGTRDLDWPLSQLFPKDVAPALRELGDALTLHNVPLY
ncbi:MAG: hypothetical protein LBN33_02040 [Desulfovibrio sp.]|jgi:hypothetical protein|nr:hypothetical protein [Desulfovibrio sp.]